MPGDAPQLKYSLIDTKAFTITANLVIVARMRRAFLRVDFFMGHLVIVARMRRAFFRVDFFVGRESVSLSSLTSHSSFSEFLVLRSASIAPFFLRSFEVQPS